MGYRTLSLCWIVSSFHNRPHQLIGWKVTVVSANFIALLMIIGISLTVHLVVRYREITSKFNDISHNEALKRTLSQMFLPCLYTALTTMVAFASLIISDIRPIIDFGLLMVLSIFYCLFCIFCLLWFSCIINE